MVGDARIDFPLPPLLAMDDVAKSIRSREYVRACLTQDTAALAFSSKLFVTGEFSTFHKRCIQARRPLVSLFWVLRFAE